jgi:hypothetical protein
VVERSPPEPELWTVYAALLIQAGDRADYRSMRRRLLDTYVTTDQPAFATRVAKACLLAEGDDLDRVMRVLETALKEGVPDWIRPHAEMTRGMAEYRRGDARAALSWLQRCQQPGRPAMSLPCQALRGFFLAMAYHRLGQRTEAAEAFGQASEQLARLVPFRAKLPDDYWKDILRAEIAEAEARRLLK